MRYLPGSIVISDEADVPLLRTVHRAGHVTIHQLYASLYPVREKRLWDTLSWRVGRLAKNEFLNRTPVPGLPGAVLSLGESGELYLQGREQFLVERAARTRGSNKRHQIWHDVELFEIQLALRRAGVVALWESEAEVKAANDFTTDRYAKDYDAVVTFRLRKPMRPSGARIRADAEMVEAIRAHLRGDGSRKEARNLPLPGPELRASCLSAARSAQRPATDCHRVGVRIRPIAAHNRVNRCANSVHASTRRLLDRRDPVSQFDGFVLTGFASALP